jgi:uroporphyrinogen III methyltransferase/synthase
VSETYNTLKGKRIIVTRAIEQSESLLLALRHNGAIPVLLPMVSFAPPDDAAGLDQALNELSHFDWVFLTSQNVLPALEKRCELLKLPFKELMASVQIAAVGPATAESAQSSGLKVTYVAKKHQGVALAEELSAIIKGKKILLPRSDRANRDLVQSLDRFGAHVTEVVAYKTIRTSEVETREFLSEIQQGADAILFFSPSAVHNLRDMMGSAKFVILSRAVAYTAIGPVTEKALRDAAVDRVISAADTNVDAVLLVLIDHFSGSLQSLPAGAKHA